MIRIYIDGSTNGFDSCICMIIEGGCLRKGLRKQVFTLEKSPIEKVEYLALIKALEFLNENHFNKKKLKIIFTDNLQIVKEINFIQHVSIYTYDYFKKSLELLNTLQNVRIQKINREKNLAGLYLEKRLKKIKNSVKKYKI